MNSPAYISATENYYATMLGWEHVRKHGDELEETRRTADSRPKRNENAD